MNFHANFSVLLLSAIGLMLAVAAIHDGYKGWKERLQIKLDDDLWRFPRQYRLLLKELGEHLVDDNVQIYLLAIVRGYEDTRILSRSGEVDRATKRFAYVLRCFPKARECADRAAYRVVLQKELLESGDDQSDEIKVSNALLARRRTANK